MTSRTVRLHLSFAQVAESYARGYAQVKKTCLQGVKNHLVAALDQALLRVPDHSTIQLPTLR